MPRHPRLQLVLGLLYALRVLLALSPAYIHPDEFFQGAEIAASDILGISGQRTWEFTSPQPVRSAAAIHVLQGPAFVLLRLLRDYLGVGLTPWRVFAAGRLGACLLTFLADWCVWRVVRRAGGRPGTTAVVLASSGGALAFFSHGFANSAAAAVLAACLDLLDGVRRGQEGAARCLVLGGLLAFGGFVHVTFPLFALPLALLALFSGMRPALRVLLGGLLASTLLVLADSLYYGRLVVAPLNNLRYNADADNLATHGQHPRYLHVLVSMPLVAGPLWAVFLWDACRGDLWTSGGMQGAAAAAATAGVAWLSLVGHQEPRFVVPALPAVVLATWPRHRRLGGGFWALWAVVGLAVVVALGTVHQAGVVPATLRIASDSVLASPSCVPLPNSTDHLCAAADPSAATHPLPLPANTGHQVTTFVFAWKTFMPPRHLLVQPSDSSSSGSSGGSDAARVVVRDLVGLDAMQAGEALRGMPQVGCASVGAGALVVDEAFGRTVLLAPASADVTSMGLRLRRVARDAPHVNFDHLAEVLRSPRSLAALDTYVLCHD